MTNESANRKPGERRAVSVKIADARECAKAISAAIEKRARELGRPCHPRSEQENWRLAEKEVLQPLCCGTLNSKDEAAVSIFCSALGVKDVQEIEVSVEPHRVILAGKSGSTTGPGEATTKYRVLSLADEIDPLSAKATLKQHGSVLEIELHKLAKEAPVAKSLVANRAA